MSVRDGYSHFVFFRIYSLRLYDFNQTFNGKRHPRARGFQVGSIGVLGPHGSSKHLNNPVVAKPTYSMLGKLSKDGLLKPLVNFVADRLNKSKTELPDHYVEHFENET